MHRTETGKLRQRLRTTGAVMPSVTERQLKDRKCSTTRGENEEKGEKKLLLTSEFGAKWSLRGND